MKKIRFVAGCLALGLSIAHADETAQWQRAIDAAAARGGGRVTIPAGRHLVGQLDLRSNVEIHLAEGAVLEGLPGLEHYRVVELPFSEGTWSAILFGLNVTNVAVTGTGEIFGNGTAWKIPEDYGGNQEGQRARGLFFADAKGIRLEGFTLRDAACWGVVFKRCADVTARRVTIDSHGNGNNDGFDIEAKDVLIEDCIVDAGDDCYCVKSNDPGFTVENVAVRRCVARSHSNGFKIGTATHGTVRNVRFESCRAEAPTRDFLDNRPSSPNFGRMHFYRPELAHLKVGGGLGAVSIENVDGGRVENVRVDGLDVAGFMVPIFVRAGTRTGRACGTPPGSQYVFRDIEIANVRGVSESGYASSISGVTGCRVRDVRLRNVDVVCRGAGRARSEVAATRAVPDVSGKYPECNMFGGLLPAYGLWADKVDGLTLENVSFRLREGGEDVRPAVVLTPDVQVLPPWKDLAIRVTSTRDGSAQPGYLYVPPAAKDRKVPLLVALHSWSFGCEFTRSPGAFGLLESAKRGWAFYYPHFRGPNNRPEACGSDLAVQDIVDGIAYAKARANIDPDRIYLLGGSGGGHMALLMAGRHPEIWAGVVAGCPISDVGRWHAETSAMTNGNARYARMLEAVCGGAPRERLDEYRHRSPVTWLAAAKGVPIQIQTGIHDGHHGNSVPVGHAVRAFNCLAAAADRVSDATIAFMERTEAVPESERFVGTDPFYPAPAREIHLRRQSGNAQLTVFNAGHASNYEAGLWWLARQRRGAPVDWTLPTERDKADAGEIQEVTR